MMIKRLKFVGVLVVGVFALGQAGRIHAADANPPERMTYQGYLVDGNGNPLGSVEDPSDPTGRASAPANYDVVFRIYNVKQGGNTDNILWAEQQTVTVDKGYFSVLLGEGSASSNGDPTGDLSDVFGGGDASDRFIGITVKGLGAGDVEIAPRLQFVASPFTFLAAYARQADKIVGTGGDVLTTDGGNIGIGNASPNSKLDVGGDIKASGAVDVGGNANVQGQLAVGTPSAPTAALDVTGAIKASSGLDIDGDSTIDGSLNLRPTGTSSALRIYASSNYSDYQLKLWNDDSASYIRNTSDSRKIIIGANNRNTLALTPDGKVGINNAGPSYDLDVDGTIRAFTGSSSVPGLIIDRYSTGNYRSELVQATDGLAIRVGHGSTEPTEKMRIKHDGKVGIGTNDPEEKLHLYGSIGVFPGSSGTIINTRRTTDDWTGIKIEQGYDGNYGASLVFKTHLNNGVAGDVNSPTEKMRITGNGNVGIGTTSPSTYLHVGIARDAEANSSGLGSFMIGPRSGLHMRMDNNELMAMSNNSTSTLYLNANGGTVKAGTSTVTSDQRLKHNIHPIKYGLSELRKLKPVSYDWKLDLFNLPGTQLGFIAQDVQKVLPELVTVEENSEESRFKDELALNVNGILPVVVASVQALDEENRQLKSDLETLKSEMAVLKARLANSTTQEDRIAKLEEMVSKIGQEQ